MIDHILDGLRLYLIIAGSFGAGVLTCAFFVGATRGDGD